MPKRDCIIPDEGMYLSQDPIGLLGGNNLYGYVEDLNLWVDVLGLAKMRCPDKKKLKELGLGGVDLKGLSFNAEKKAGFKKVGTTNTRRVIFESDKGTRVYYDGTKKGFGSLAGKQSPHWHIQESEKSGGKYYNSKGKIANGDDAHVPSNKGNKQF